MPLVKLRANLGSNDFPAPLCTFKDGEEHEVGEQWVARLVNQGLAVVVVPPLPVAVASAPAGDVSAESQSQERSAEPARQPNTNKQKKEK